MRRVIAIFGIALMVLAFVILTIFIIAPAIIMPLDNAPLLKDIMQIAVCNSNETLTADYSTYDTPGTTSTSIDYNCVDKQQNARDVSQDILKMGGISYLVLFLIGLFTFMFARQKTDKPTPSSFAAAKSDPTARNARAERLEASQKSSGGSAYSTSSRQAHPHAEGHVPLAQRLQELKEALNAGLITEEEYKAKRQELLNES